MFNNIGLKIKVLVKTVFCVSAVALVVFGIVETVNEKSFLPILVCLALLAVIWFSMFAFYALGEMVDKISQIEDKLGRLFGDDDDFYKKDPEEEYEEDPEEEYEEDYEEEYEEDSEEDE